MQKNLFLRGSKFVVLLVANLVFGLAVRATTVSIPVHIWFEGSVSNGLSLSGTFLESAPGANDGDVTKNLAGAGALIADLGTVHAEPGRSYPVVVGGNGSLADGALNVVAPPGFYAEIEGIVRNRRTMGYGIAIVRVLPHPALAPRQASVDVSQATGKIDWRLSLGSLRNGSSAGELALIDAGFMNDWSPVYTPALLDCEPLSAEIQVYRDSGWIRQVIANETAVDVVTTSSSSYEIRFYHPTQVQGTVAPFSFSGQPYAVYLLERDGAAGATKLKITRQCYNISNATVTGLAPARTEVMSIERSGTAWPNYDWTHNAWTLKDQPCPIQRTVDSGGTSSARNEMASVRVPGGSAAANASRNYAVKPWGEVITSEKFGSGANAPSTTFAYYEDSTQPGSYAFLKSMLTASGNWEAYEYFDTAVATSTRAGTIKFRFRPYLDSPATTSLVQSAGEITEFDYSIDAFGFRTRPALRQTTVNGILTAKSTTTYVETTVNGMDLVEATQRDYTSATKYLQTITRYYKESLADAFFRGQLHSATRPDGVKTVYAHQRGTWNGTIFSPTGGNGLGVGTASRETIIMGSSSSTAGSVYTAHDGYDIDDVYLVDGKSTMHVTIRDKRALIVRSETYARSNKAWNLVGFTDYTYNFVGQLTHRNTSHGGNYDADYDGRLLTEETDESGVIVSYLYDNAGRLLSATKADGPKTTYAYDAASRVTATTTSANGTAETIVSRQEYDDSGRPINVTPPGLPRTTAEYDIVARSVTTTTPDGATTIRTSYRDGRPQKLTGTSGVARYFSYGVEADGRRFTQINVGAENSVRLEKSWTDWTGRGTKTQQPGFSHASNPVDFITEEFYEDGTGRLFKSTRTGYAPKRYEYDALGSIVRMGLDVNDNGLVLASADRITDSDTMFAYDSVSKDWWLKTTTKTYPTFDSGTGFQTSTTRSRLTNFPANRLSEIQVTDAEANTATTTTEVNRLAKTVTTKTSVPGLTNSQSSTIINGLVTSSVDNSLLTTGFEYDSLGRPWRTTDSRSNTITNAYYEGTTLLRSITDGAGNVVSTIGYDGLGRTAWTQDAAFHVARFNYNLRGQVTNQWGDGTTPVSYAYDPIYGDRTSLSTYRNAPATDAPAWPAGAVGNADTTLWEYDVPTGLVWKKTDATGQYVENTYNERGQIARHFTARGVSPSDPTRITSTYIYDPATGELTSCSYNDGTPGVSYDYTRLGQVRTVNDAIGTRTFTYDSIKPWRLKNETLPSDFGGLWFTELYESSTGGIAGRYRGFKLGASSDDESILKQEYAFTPTGRFDALTSKRAANSVSAQFQYHYDPNAPLVTGYESGANFSVAREYEAYRDILKSIDSRWTAAGVSNSLTRYDFTTNPLGQRATAQQSGSAFSDYYTPNYASVLNHYTYNARGELETAALYSGDVVPAIGALPPSANELFGRRFEYRYDGAGNRQTSGATGNALLLDDEYATNSLNQYTSRENNTVRVTGTAALAAAVAVKGATSTNKKDRAWVADFIPSNIASATSGSLTTYAALPQGGTGGADVIKVDTSRNYFVPKFTQIFSYDADGNLNADNVWDYSYDAENRLVAMQQRPEVIGNGMIPPNSARRLEFKYDYLGRRVAKIVKSGWDGTNFTQQLSYTKFIYDGWNLVAEFSSATTNATSLGALLRAYTWGLDLSGSLTETGGVGALLQVYDAGTNKTYLPTYDGNGNVVTMVESTSGSLEAIYEYSPFGELIRNQGPYAAINPFRFSTKYTDLETGLSYYGLRYYSASLGRFINRDPIEESGGLNLYGFCGNDGVNQADRLGMRYVYRVYWTGSFRAPQNRYNDSVEGEMELSEGWFWVDDDPGVDYALWVRPSSGDAAEGSGGTYMPTSIFTPPPIFSAPPPPTVPPGPPLPAFGGPPEVNWGNLTPPDHLSGGGFSRDEWTDEAEHNRVIGDGVAYQDMALREKWYSSGIGEDERFDVRFAPDGTRIVRWEENLRNDEIAMAKTVAWIVVPGAAEDLLAGVIATNFGGRAIAADLSFTTLYHGTSAERAALIRAGGIDLEKSRPLLDFGKGFYTTTDFVQAKDWAERFYGARGEVLTFRIPTSALQDLRSLTFSTGDTQWESFVVANRRGAPLHNFDVVTGPMLANPIPAAAGAPPIPFGQQTSFHTDAGVSLLNGFLVH